MSEVEFDLNVAAGIKKAIRSLTSNGQDFTAGYMHCPKCGEARRVFLRHLSSLRADNYGNPENPVFMEVTCLQCETVGHVVVATGPTGDAVFHVWPVAGGVATPNTHPSVGYYLDQASKCESANANSAAAAMYRAALEHLMFEQGFTDGMLATKINDLIKARDAGTAPEWAKNLDDAFLTTIKKAGDGAIHPNGGDVSKQEHIDEELLAGLRLTIGELLEVIYEQPVARAERLAKMQATVEKLKK